MPSREDLRAAGKALRRKTSRKAQAAFDVQATRPDLIQKLIESSEGRVPELVPVRYGRMLRSPFHFFRGAAGIMAADLSRTPDTRVAVQACGDCHLFNFGGFATPERRMVFDINDFDETLPAPWEWDVKRLAASFVIAGRNDGLREDECRTAAVTVARSYRERMAELGEMPVLEAWYSYIDLEKMIDATRDPELLRLRRKRLRKALETNFLEIEFSKLVDHENGRPRIKDRPPTIFHVDAKNDPRFEERIAAAVKEYRRSLPHERQVLFDRYMFADAAFKVVGVGSVGTNCYVALFFSSVGDPLFLQIKEARPSVLEPYTAKSHYENPGERVVVGQRIMQAASDVFLGWTSADGGQRYYVRQLRDAKVNPTTDAFSAQALEEYAGDCGWALARAHARSGSAPMLAGYMGKGDALDEAIGAFATAYADQNERDYTLFRSAVRSGKIEATTEPSA